MLPTKHSLGYLQWTTDEQRECEFFWMLGLGFLHVIASFSFKLPAGTAQAFLLVLTYLPHVEDIVRPA